MPKKTTKKRKCATQTPQDVDFSKPLKNPRYEQFCQAFMATNNETQAAKDAKYSPKTAYSKGNQLLKIVEIKGRIKYLQDGIADACGVTARRLMEEWKKIGFANIKECISSGNTIKDVSRLPDDVAAAIDSISTSKTAHGRTVKLTLHSKTKALEDMGKMIGAYIKDNEQRAGLTLADIAALAGVNRASS